MSYLAGAVTDVGTTKPTNQDSLLVKIGMCQDKDIALAILCDGMGGLKKGEIASAVTIKAFERWALTKMPALLKREDFFVNVRKDWEEVLYEINLKLREYGIKHGINLGTTITGLLCADNKYIAINVGDSRTYKINENITKITEDQSFVANEIKQGRLTEMQAKKDPRRNILLQCVGVIENLEIEFYEGCLQKNEAILICSDGFIHEISEEEIWQEMNPDKIKTEEDIENRLRRLTDTNINRGETDNITAAYLKMQ